MKKKIINVIIVLLFVIGLSLVIYPSFSNYWNQRHQTKAIAGYEEKVEDLTEKQYEKLWNDATLYNKNLRHTMYALNDDEKKIYNPVFDSYTHKNPSKILINSAFFEGLFALKMC